MSLIIPPGYLQAVYVLSLVGDPENMVVTCGHEIDTGSGANNDDAANDLFTAFADNILEGSLQAAFTLEAVDVYIGNDGPNIVRTSSEAPRTGIGTALMNPPNVAALMRKRTDLAGRRGRGRMYLPGVREQDTDNVGNLATATVTNYNTVFASWMADLTTAVGARHYPPVVLHRSEGAGIEPAPTPIVSFLCEPKVATQRRRLRP